MMQSNMTKISLAATTAAAALAAYDEACAVTEGMGAAGACHVWRQSADLLASALRKPKAVAKPKASTFIQAFTATLKTACGVIERRNSIPILSNVRLTATGGALAVAASDLDVDYRHTVTGYGGPDFDTTVPAHMLLNLLKGAETLEFDVSELEGRAVARLTVIINGAVSQLAALPAGDFPEMAKVKFAAAAEIPELGDALGFVAPAISAEETRYYLNGAFLTSETRDGKQVLRVVATDGSRMATQTLPAPMPWPHDGVIIPRKTVGLLCKALGGDVLPRLEVCATQIRVTIPGVGVFASRLIDGAFPDYNRVIPSGKEHKTVASIADPKTFVAALKRCAAISSERSRSVRLEMAKGGALNATVRNMESDQVRSRLPAVVTGEAREISFNALYVAEAIIGPCSFMVAGPNEPALILYEGRPDRLQILMPLRV